MFATHPSIRPWSQRLTPVLGLYFAMTLCMAGSATTSELDGGGLSQPRLSSSVAEAMAGLRFSVPYPEATLSALEALFGTEDALISFEVRAWAYPTQAARLGLLAARRSRPLADARLSREIDAEIRVMRELRRRHPAR
jgi:hypothetical protein